MSQTELTPEQSELLRRKADEWMAVGLTLGKGDIEVAKEGIRAAYVAADHPEPEYFVHLSSPYAGALATCAVKMLFAAVYANHTNDFTHPLTKKIQDALRTTTLPDGVSYHARDTTLASKTLDETYRQLLPQLLAKNDDMPNFDIVWPIVRAHLYDQMDTRTLEWESAPVYGAHDAAWLAFYDTLGDMGMADIVAPMRGTMQAAREVGWWWPLKDVVIITDRPIVLHRDANGDLHHESGPALMYEDGWGMWVIDRVVLTQQIVEAPETLTVDQIIDESNAQIKQIMLARYGLENFVRNANATKLDASDFGILWSVDVKDTEPVVMAEVVCPSTEKVYMLRVPPTLTTAKDAVAWTWDMPSAEYTPQVQA